MTILRNIHKNSIILNVTYVTTTTKIKTSITTTRVETHKLNREESISYVIGYLGIRRSYYFSNFKIKCKFYYRKRKKQKKKICSESEELIIGINNAFFYFKMAIACSLGL